jgi:hypothetical protein
MKSSSSGKMVRSCKDQLGFERQAATVVRDAKNDRTTRPCAALSVRASAGGRSPAKSRTKASSLSWPKSSACAPLSSPASGAAAAM